jgi:hypothetical protein
VTLAEGTTTQATVTRTKDTTETKQEFPTKNGHARPWKVVAGPAEKYSARSLAAATIPDGPDGNYERIEAQNRAALRAHFAKLAKDCLIQPHRPPINILGSNKEWKDRTGNAVFADVTGLDLSPLPVAAGGPQSDWRPCLPSDHATLP